MLWSRHPPALSAVLCSQGQWPFSCQAWVGFSRTPVCGPQPRASGSVLRGPSLLSGHACPRLPAPHSQCDRARAWARRPQAGSPAPSDPEAVPATEPAPAPWLPRAPGCASGAPRRSRQIGPRLLSSVPRVVAFARTQRPPTVFRTGRSRFSILASL